MRRGKGVPILIVAFLAAAPPALLSGCGGRAAARPAAEPGGPETSREGGLARPESPSDDGPARPESRPARLSPPSSGSSESMSATPAVRLDRFADGDGGRDGASDGRPPGPPRGGDPGRDAAAGGRPGLYHDLRRGETLYALSRTYGVPIKTLMQVNGITDPRSLRAGTPILIPGSAVKGKALMAGAPALAWPLRGPITGRFGRRGKRSHHEGLDIDGRRGDEIVAAAAGRIVEARSRQKYGRMVVIDHGGGVKTLYAHADRLLVEEGEWVEQGDPIAEVGRTGNARGTHLHFEVRHHDRPVDPLPLLRHGAQTASETR